jgi:hypothetical protein
MNRIVRYIVFAAAILLLVVPAFAQNGQLTGQITDPQGAAVPNAAVRIVNQATHVERKTKTNESGLFAVPFLVPGTYRIFIEAQGFEPAGSEDLILTVGQVLVFNAGLKIGSSTAQVNVTGESQLINTTDATVSTVIDRQFVANLPMNGRSFQTLIELTPGVVLMPTSADAGGFSVNGQRTTSNYFTVDGVGANIGVDTFAETGNREGGAVPGVTALGGFNNLVSIDALQEFQIQTSSFAPEFGRTPGAQIQIVTRSGGNQFHGDAFEYLRNNIFDANDWFANEAGLPRAEERINDFGGVLGGPIIKDKTFFFFSYEGQRLRLPLSVKTAVPSLAARQAAVSGVAQLLDAYPLPNGPDLGNGTAQLSADWSDRSSLDATSIRIDQAIGKHFNLFGRYNIAPSNLFNIASQGYQTPSAAETPRLRTQTATIGLTWTISSTMANEFRFNYSRNSLVRAEELSTFGGAVPPPESLLFPSGYSPSTGAVIDFNVLDLGNTEWGIGPDANNIQRQVNVVDNFSVQRGTHALKFGVDYRRLFPIYNPPNYFISSYMVTPLDPSIDGTGIYIATGADLLYRNVGSYAQDTWKVNSRLSVTYGLRWDFDFPPKITNNSPPIPAVTTSNPFTAALAPAGTPVFHTRYKDFAPRLGIAYQLRQTAGRETVLRVGAGLFNDLAAEEAADGVSFASYPYGGSKTLGSLVFPLTASEAAPPTISPSGSVTGIDPHLRPPLIYQWNATLEQSLGSAQKLSLAYVGSTGHYLTAESYLIGENPNFAFLSWLQNFATSSYNSMQVQFQRRLSKGLQALVSYTWSHSIDDASSVTSFSNVVATGASPTVLRGSSDFDIRNTFSGALTYDIPSPRGNGLVRAVLGDWSTDNIVQVRSAPPDDLTDGLLYLVGPNELSVRPDIVPGQPLYVYGPQYPGGKAFNPNAFTNPPLDPVTGQPTRNGDAPRNLMRGFGATQWDFTLRRQFTLHEALKLQFRAEFFNLLNHPNFGVPVNDISNPLFGQANTMLNKYLGGANAGEGGFDSIFQLGGPRSMQFAVKFIF